MAATVRARLKPKARTAGGAWARYMLGRVLQVAGLMVTLVAATQFFGTRSTIAMLRMMLIGVVIFVAGWLILPRDPRAGTRDYRQ